MELPLEVFGELDCYYGRIILIVGSITDEDHNRLSSMEYNTENSYKSTYYCTDVIRIRYSNTYSSL